MQWSLLRGRRGGFLPPAVIRYPDGHRELWIGDRSCAPGTRSAQASVSGVDTTPAMARLPSRTGLRRTAAKTACPRPKPLSGYHVAIRTTKCQPEACVHDRDRADLRPDDGMPVPLARHHCRHACRILRNRCPHPGLLPHISAAPSTASTHLVAPSVRQVAGHRLSAAANSVKPRHLVHRTGTLANPEVSPGKSGRVTSRDPADIRRFQHRGGRTMARHFQHRASDHLATQHRRQTAG